MNLLRCAGCGFENFYMSESDHELKPTTVDFINTGIKTNINGEYILACPMCGTLKIRINK